MKSLFSIVLLVAAHGCATTSARNVEMSESTPARIMDIELLALDLTSCGRCTGTDRNLTAAIDDVAGLLRQTGTQVRVTRHVVTTADEAEQFRLESSPTIRIAGRDIALEFKESSCKDCGDLCGCDGGVDCRVWVWQGQEHLEAPKGMIVDALLKPMRRARLRSRIRRTQCPPTCRTSLPLRASSNRPRRTPRRQPMTVAATNRRAVNPPPSRRAAVTRRRWGLGSVNRADASEARGQVLLSPLYTASAIPKEAT